MYNTNEHTVADFSEFFLINVGKIVKFLLLACAFSCMLNNVEKIFLNILNLEE